MENPMFLIDQITKLAPGMIFQYNLSVDGKTSISYASDYIKEVFDLSLSDVENDDSLLLKKIHPDDLDGFLKSINDSAISLQEWSYEYRVVLPNKDTQWYLGKSRPIKNEDGKITWIGIISNITNYKIIEQELIHSSRLYSVIEAINEAFLNFKKPEDVFYETCKSLVLNGKFLMSWIGIWDEHNQFLKPLTFYGINDSHLKELLNSTFSPVINEKIIINNNIEDDTSFNVLKNNLLKDGCSSSIVLPIFFKGKAIGSLNVYSSEKDIFRNSELFLLENISKLVSLSIDSLEKEIKQHESEESLRISEAKNRTIFEEAPLGIALVDSNYGIFLRSNPAISNILGRTQEELRKISWMSIIHPDDFSKVQEFSHNLSFKKNSSFKLVIRIFHKDNHIIWLNMSFVAFANGSGDISNFLIMAEDVSENMLNQLNLKKSQEMFSAVTDLSPDLITIVDKDGSIFFNSAASFFMHGYQKIDLNGKNLLDFILCDDRQLFSKEFLEISNNPNKILNLQYRFLNKDGSSSWIEAAGINQLQNPLINGIIIISRDIGKRKKMEEDLRRALESRDEFLSIASHELKTPITSLKLQLQILSKKTKSEDNVLSDPNTLPSLISNSIKQVDRITDLVDNLLDVSRIQTGKLLFNFEKINLSKSILNLLDCFRELFLQAGIVLDVRIEPDLECFVDKNRMDQVFINLFSNAIKYAPGKPVLISFKKIDGIAEFMIQDQGPGIASEKKSLIFNRFERANSSAKISGLGLGLYISRYIVEAHKGNISVESSLGIGSIFKVDLPLYSS